MLRIRMLLFLLPSATLYWCWWSWIWSRVHSCYDVTSDNWCATQRIYWKLGATPLHSTANCKHSATQHKIHRCKTCKTQMNSQMKEFFGSTVDTQMNSPMKELFSSTVHCGHTNEQSNEIIIGQYSTVWTRKSQRQSQALFLRWN